MVRSLAHHKDLERGNQCVSFGLFRRKRALCTTSVHWRPAGVIVWQQCHGNAGPRVFMSGVSVFCCHPEDWSSFFSSWVRVGLMNDPAGRAHRGLWGSRGPSPAIVLKCSGWREVPWSSECHSGRHCTMYTQYQRASISLPLSLGQHTIIHPSFYLSVNLSFPFFLFYSSLLPKHMNTFSLHMSQTLPPSLLPTVLHTCNT